MKKCLTSTRKNMDLLVMPMESLGDFQAYLPRHFTKTVEEDQISWKYLFFQKFLALENRSKNSLICDQSKTITDNPLTSSSSPLRKMHSFGHYFHDMTSNWEKRILKKSIFNFIRETTANRDKTNREPLTPKRKATISKSGVIEWSCTQSSKLKS